MSTQEKLVMKLIDEICDYDEYCGDENCKQCGGPIKFWKKKLTDLIDSAKREGAIEMLKNMKKSLMVARINPGLKPLQLPEDARIQQMIADEFDRNIAQLEQSEESI